ncbi:DUF4443 domain-containing protein [Candidatus Bathyarchaeota archaeon]|nr:MAG: DUF4443 domain-containing protein [Candidatus Bathyarchaeota archaeon]
MLLKYLLRELIGEKAPGPTPSFSVVHVIRALELLGEKPIGRNRLSQKLTLGEGATRTLIERLRSLSLIVVDRKGCAFSRKGRKLWSTLHATIPRKTVLKESGLTLAPFNVAILVKDGSSNVRFGIEQRDAALLAGAKGATTLISKNGRLTIPPDCRDLIKDFPEIHRRLVDSLKPGENDAIVIGSADTLEKAEFGALAAAWTLLDRS